MSKSTFFNPRNPKGNSKRTGMIEFARASEAEEALKKTGTILEGYYINIIMSTSAIMSDPSQEIMELLEKTEKMKPLSKEERLENTIIVTEIDNNLNDNQIMECFGYCGKIKNSELKKEGNKYVFLKIEYQEKINADCAIHFNQFQLGNKKLSIKKSTEIVK